MAGMLLARWERGHVLEAENTQTPGDNRLPRWTSCENARLRGEMAQTRLTLDTRQGVGTAQASRAGNPSDAGAGVMEKDAIDLTPAEIRVVAARLKNLRALTDGQLTMLALYEIVSVLEDIPIGKRIPLSVTLRERTGLKE